MAQKRTRRRFTAEFKAQAVKRALDGGRSLVEIATGAGREHRAAEHVAHRALGLGLS